MVAPYVGSPGATPAAMDQHQQDMLQQQQHYLDLDEENRVLRREVARLQQLNAARRRQLEQLQQHIDEQPRRQQQQQQHDTGVDPAAHAAVHAELSRALATIEALEKRVQQSEAMSPPPRHASPATRRGLSVGCATPVPAAPPSPRPCPECPATRLALATAHERIADLEATEKEREARDRAVADVPFRRLLPGVCSLETSLHRALQGRDAAEATLNLVMEYTDKYLDVVHSAPALGAVLGWRGAVRAARKRAVPQATQTDPLPEPAPVVVTATPVARAASPTEGGDRVTSRVSATASVSRGSSPMSPVAKAVKKWEERDAEDGAGIWEDLPTADEYVYVGMDAATRSSVTRRKARRASDIWGRAKDTSLSRSPPRRSQSMAPSSPTPAAYHQNPYLETSPTHARVPRVAEVAQRKVLERRSPTNTRSDERRSPLKHDTRTTPVQVGDRRDQASPQLRAATGGRSAAAATDTGRTGKSVTRTPPPRLDLGGDDTPTPAGHAAGKAKAAASRAGRRSPDKAEGDGFARAASKGAAPVAARASVLSSPPSGKAKGADSAAVKGTPSRPRDPPSRGGASPAVDTPAGKIEQARRSDPGTSSPVPEKRISINLPSPPPTSEKAEKKDKKEKKEREAALDSPSSKSDKKEKKEKKDKNEALDSPRSDKKEKKEKKDKEDGPRSPSSKSDKEKKAKKEKSSDALDAPSSPSSKSDKKEKKEKKDKSGLDSPSSKTDKKEKKEKKDKSGSPDSPRSPSSKADKKEKKEKKDKK